MGIFVRPHKPTLSLENSRVSTRPLPQWRGTCDLDVGDPLRLGEITRLKADLDKATTPLRPLRTARRADRAMDNPCTRRLSPPRRKPEPHGFLRRPDHNLLTLRNGSGCHEEGDRDALAVFRTRAETDEDLVAQLDSFGWWSAHAGSSVRMCHSVCRGPARRARLPLGCSRRAAAIQRELPTLSGQLLSRLPQLPNSRPQHFGQKTCGLLRTRIDDAVAIMTRHVEGEPCVRGFFSFLPSSPPLP